MASKYENEGQNKANNDYECFTTGNCSQENVGHTNSTYMNLEIEEPCRIGETF